MLRDNKMTVEQGMSQSNKHILPGEGKNYHLRATLKRTRLTDLSRALEEKEILTYQLWPLDIFMCG
jgi:hypothetical protein